MASVYDDGADGFVFTDNGAVQFHWELAGPGGAEFILKKKPETTRELLKAAAKHLRATQDVVRVVVINESKWPEHWKPICYSGAS